MRMALHKVHSGWLTKSPPEKKPPGRLKLFRAHWRRRYFVLSSYQSQSPGGGGGEEAPPAYYLHYYDNDRNPPKSREKGCIDLSSCEEILAELESDCYDNVFSLRTQHKGRSRTYCLAADSVEEMNQWINCLIKVLQMDDFDPLMTRPETQFQKSSGIKPVSCATRHRTYPLNRSDYPPPNQTSAAVSSSALCRTLTSAEGANSGDRFSMSCSSLVQSVPRSPHFRGGDNSEDNDSTLPPPSLPPKTRRNRLRDLDGGGDWRVSASHVHQEAAAAAADQEEFPSGGGSGGGGGGDDDSALDGYDFLPAGRRSVRSIDDDDDALQFPALTSFSEDEMSSPDVPGRRKSTSSHSGGGGGCADALFESADDQLCGPKSNAAPFSTSIQVTQMTRSFRRSASRSNHKSVAAAAAAEQEDMKDQN